MKVQRFLFILACQLLFAAPTFGDHRSGGHPPQGHWGSGDGRHFSYDETGIASWYGEQFHGKYTANGEVFDLNALTAAHRTLPMPSIVQVTNLANGRSIQLRVNDRGPYVSNRIIDLSRRAAQLLGIDGPGTAKVRVKVLVPESIQVASLTRGNGGDKVVAEAPPAVPRGRIAAESLTAPTNVHVASRKPPALASVALRGLPPSATLAPSLTENVTMTPVKSTQIYIQAGAYAQADNAMRVKTRLDPLGAVVIMGTRSNSVDLLRVRLGPIRTVDEADKLLDRVIATGLAEARIVVD
jgi:rare lipoprotein A